MNVITKLDELEKYARLCARRTEHYSDAQLRVDRDPYGLHVYAVQVEPLQKLHAQVDVEVRPSTNGCTLVAFVSVNANGRYASVKTQVSAIQMIAGVASALHSRIDGREFEP